MKNLTIVFLLFLPVGIFAQEECLAYSRSCNHRMNVFEWLGDGSYLMAGEATNYYNWEGRGFVVRYSSKGATLFEKILHHDYLSEGVDDVEMFRNGDYIICGSSRGCDFGGNGPLRRFDAFGNQLFAVKTNAHRLALSQDEKYVLQISPYSDLYRASAVSGWVLAHNKTLGGADILALPESDSFLIASKKGLYLINLDLKEILKVPPTTNAQYFTKIGYADWDICYGILNDGAVAKCKWNKDGIVKSHKPPFKVRDMALISEGNVVICGARDLMLLDSNFSVKQHVVYPDSLFIIGQIGARSASEIRLVGYEMHGPDKRGLTNGYLYDGSINMSVRTFSFGENNPSTNKYTDIGVSNMTISKAPTVIKSGDKWYIDNSKIDITLTNYGKTTIDSVVLISNDLIHNNLRFNCVGKALTHKVIVFNPPLQAGQSYVYNYAEDFGPGPFHFLYPDTSITPWTPCFWTTAPNNRQDANISNDHYCGSFYLTTSSGSIGEEDDNIHIYPNPFDNHLFIAQAEEDICRIFDMQGRQISMFEHKGGAEPTHLDTAEWPQGAYLIHFGKGRIQMVFK